MRGEGLLVGREGTPPPGLLAREGIHPLTLKSARRLSTEETAPPYHPQGAKGRPDRRLQCSHEQATSEAKASANALGPVLRRRHWCNSRGHQHLSPVGLPSTGATFGELARREVAWCQVVSARSLGTRAETAPDSSRRNASASAGKPDSGKRMGGQTRARAGREACGELEGRNRRRRFHSPAGGALPRRQPRSLAHLLASWPAPVGRLLRSSRAV